MSYNSPFAQYGGCVIHAQVVDYDRPPQYHKRLPYSIYPLDAALAVFPDELSGFITTNDYFGVYDRCAGVESMRVPFGTPIYYNGYVAECVARKDNKPPYVTWCTAKEYLDKHGLQQFPHCSAEYTVLYTLMWESVSVRACQVGVMMTKNHWLNMYLLDRALPYQHRGGCGVNQ